MFELFMMLCLLGISLSQLLPNEEQTGNSNKRRIIKGRKKACRSDRRSESQRSPVRRYQRQADSARTPVNCSGGIGRLK